jgi:hypothetical protein
VIGLVYAIGFIQQRGDSDQTAGAGWRGGLVSLFLQAISGTQKHLI